MKLEVHTVSDRGSWERFWQQHGPRALFQSWLWGEVVKKQGYPLWRFGLYEGSSLVGIAQVAKVQGRRGTYLHVRHGPVLPMRSPHWEAFIAALESLARQERAWFARVNPQIEDTPGHRAFFQQFRMIPSVLHEVDAERCLLLSLDQPESELLACMRKSTRYEIRRAETKGIRVTRSTNPVDLAVFFRLYKETSKRQHFVPHRGIQEEFELFASEGNAELLWVHDQGRALCAAIILFSDGQAIYHHGASIPTKLPASYAIQWEAIRMAKNRGMRWYNAWGVAPADDVSHPWYGHSLFKRGFGGVEVVTMHAHDLRFSPLYSITRSVEWVQERLRGY